MTLDGDGREKQRSVDDEIVRAAGKSRHLRREGGGVECVGRVQTSARPRAKGEGDVTPCVEIGRGRR